MDGHFIKKINEIYTNPANTGSFSGLSGLSRALKEKKIKATKSEIKKYLNSKESYSLHKPKRLNYPRKQVIVNGIDDTWQIDLVDVSSIKNENEGYKFIFTCIDVFSKYTQAAKMKSKDKYSSRDVFAEMIKKRKPKKVQCDKGSEFFNDVFKKLLQEKGIRMYSTDSDLKASIVERFNRTLKEKMWRFFTAKGTKKWIDVLPDFIKSYNNTYHRSIDKKPNQVIKANEGEVFLTLYKHKKTGNSSTIQIKFKVGDYVRLSKIKKTFEKGYTPNWTREIFKIDKIIATVPPSYKIKDLNNQILLGSFYDLELQKVDELGEIFEIDRIIKTKTINKKKQYFVSWKGYPDSFNSWVPETDIVST